MEFLQVNIAYLSIKGAFKSKHITPKTIKT